jgi:hypothetical protein
MFNPSKTVKVVIGHTTDRDFLPVCVDEHPIPWVDHFKYMGVVFNACGALTVDMSFIKCKFYASLNSVLVGCSSAEHVKVQLIKSFCQPLLTYCIGALELSVSAVNELAVCWNNAF